MNGLLYFSQEYKNSVFTPFKKSKNITGSFSAVVLNAIFGIEKKFPEFDINKISFTSNKNIETIVLVYQNKTITFSIDFKRKQGINANYIIDQITKKLS